MLFKKCVTYEKRLEKYFDNYAAEEAYRLVKYEIKNGKVQEDFYCLGGGNKEWARKIAQHYNLSVTEPIHEED